MFKVIFGLTPGWIKDVEKKGKPATAIVKSDPQAVLKGVGGYEGKDGWIDVQVEVQPADEPAYEAKMKCKLSQAVFGAMRLGQKVNVRYDAKDRQRVLLTDGVQALLQSRVKK